MFDEKNSIKYKYSTKNRVIDIHAWVELCRSGVSGETYFVWWSIRGTGGTCTIDAEKTHDRRDREHECNVHWPARPRSACPCKCDSLRCTSSPSLSLSLSFSHYLVRFTPSFLSSRGSPRALTPCSFFISLPDRGHDWNNSRCRRLRAIPLCPVFLFLSSRIIREWRVHLHKQVLS